MEPLVPKDHDPGEDASYADFRFSFYEDGREKDEDGRPSTVLSQIESHFHNVNNAALVDALLVVARKIVADHMVDGMFSDNVPDPIRHAAAEMLATNWLINRMNSGGIRDARPVEFAVPDDASELFKKD